MIIPVKCFTCGNVIGDKYRYFLAETIRRKKNQNIDVNKIHYLTNHSMNNKSIEGQIMDELGLYKMCCRRHFMTHVDLQK